MRGMRGWMAVLAAALALGSLWGDDMVAGTRDERGFVVGNVLHTDDAGDVRFSLYVPEGYDGKESVALFVTLPGWDGLSFQGIGADLGEPQGFEARRYDERMLVLSPQVSDWGPRSAKQVIRLTEWILSRYAVDPSRVYLAGYSAGGETGSLVVSERPDLFRAYLETASRWDGDYDAVVRARLPVRLAVGEDDSYYGSGPLKEAYRNLVERYRAQGLAQEEIDRLVVLDVRGKAYFDAHDVSDQHAGGLTIASDADSLGWLFGPHPHAGFDVLRPGSSDAVTPTPSDFPAAYAYGDGTLAGWSRELMLKKLPAPARPTDTVRSAVPDPGAFQAFYLWEEGNMPSVTHVRPTMRGYFDPPDFRPYVTVVPLPAGVRAVGAVVLMAGGAYEFRGNYTDALPTAARLRERGFVCFLVDYRLHPYTQQEGALDVARAVRFARKQAGTYGYDSRNIAVMGYSAGGIQAGQFLMGYDEDVDGTVLDPSYRSDDLDRIPAHAAADGMIYAFYGRLSHGTLDAGALEAASLPPTFFVYGTEDPFFRQFEAQYALLRRLKIASGRIVLDGWPHGFGGDGGWVDAYAAWLMTVFGEDEA